MTSTRTYNRAPKGGLTFNGRTYKGGQFVPAAAVERKSEWVIVPVDRNGTRRYLAIAKLASGEEVACDRPAFESVLKARLHIISRFDGGRAFPKPYTPFAYTAAQWAEFEDIRDRHRVAF